MTAPSADLALALTDGVDSVMAGDGVTRRYTITVSNAAGGAPASNVELTGQWPPGLARSGVTPSQGSCSGPANFTCSLGTVMGGATATVDVSYTVPAGTTSSPQVHSATVSTSSSETTMANNSAADSDLVATSADLAVTKDDGIAGVGAGDGVTRTFTITARNLGPSDSQGVQLFDVWPAGYSRGSVTDAYGSCSGMASFTCGMGSIPAGGSRSITVSYTVPAAAPLPGVNSPRGIAVNESTGSIYAVDWWNQRVERFDANGTFRSAWGRRGTTAEPGSINFAWDAAVDPSTGNVFVANRESHEIEVLDASGIYLTRWGTRGTGPGKFTFPQGVAFDPTDGSLHVTDSGNGRIERFSVTAGGQGTFLTSYGSKGTAAGQFATPTGIDVADDGTIWVADTQNDRVERRNPSTGVWTVYATAQGDTAGFTSPWGVTVAPNGQIWVADTGRDRLVRMSAGGVFSSAVDRTTLGIASMDAPFDVAFGVDGSIYVSVVWDNRILQLSQT